MLKQCTKCQEAKDITLYGCDKYKKDGRRSQCKECIKLIDHKRYWSDPLANRERVAAYRAVQKIENPGKIELSNKNTKLKATYGITVADLLQMKAAQSGCCYICKTPETALKGRHLNVDHCHASGKVRKLLCANCNTALGLLKEDVTIMNSLIAYVNENR